MNPWTVWGFAGVGIALVAGILGALGYRSYKRYVEAHRPPPPPRPAIEVALERLAALEEEGLAQKGEAKRLGLELSEILREFVEGTYGFNATDMTTWELLRELRHRDLGRASIAELEDFLGLCDLIKFAKYVPSQPELEELLPRARDLVEKLWASRSKEGTDIAV